MRKKLFRLGIFFFLWGIMFMSGAMSCLPVASAQRLSPCYPAHSGFLYDEESSMERPAPCEPAPYDPAPCEPVPYHSAPCESVYETCNPCGMVRNTFDTSSLNWGGWVEMGFYDNDNGGISDNGPIHCESNRRTDFLMNQLYLFGEKEIDSTHGFDWGARADFVYGVDAPDMQNKDGRFDDGWGKNRHGYGMSVYQLYATLGYKDLQVKIGKFITPLGWEAVAAQGNFFYSHSYCYWIEPSTHSGILASYDLTDRLALSAGWTSGENSSFDNPNRNRSVLAGFTFSLTDKATVYYWFNGGKQYGEEILNDYFVQSLCFEWIPTDRFTYVLQYNLRNTEVPDDGSYSVYGINNHFLYSLNDQWKAGLRFEWLRDNGEYGYITEDAGDYYQVTLGLNWNPTEHLSIRPEVRYDWYKGAGLPFGGNVPYEEDGTQKDQVTGGCGIVVSF